MSGTVVSLSPEENRYPSPEEFVERWPLLTPERRLELAESFIEAAGRANSCLLQGHNAELDYLRSAVKAARSEGYDKGYAEGYADGYAEGME
jgi:flagellar biosynthesis/type III secretory pathway protein FliH